MLSFLSRFLMGESDEPSSGLWEQESGPELTKAGFQVMFVRPESASQLAGLVPVFDYIVASEALIFVSTTTTVAAA